MPRPYNADVCGEIAELVGCQGGSRIHLVPLPWPRNYRGAKQLVRLNGMSTLVVSILALACVQAYAEPAQEAPSAPAAQPSPEQAREIERDIQNLGSSFPKIADEADAKEILQ